MLTVIEYIPYTTIYICLVLQFSTKSIDKIYSCHFTLNRIIHLNELFQFASAAQLISHLIANIILILNIANLCLGKLIYVVSQLRRNLSNKLLHINCALRFKVGKEKKKKKKNPYERRRTIYIFYHIWLMGGIDGNFVIHVFLLLGKG